MTPFGSTHIYIICMRPSVWEMTWQHETQVFLFTIMNKLI